MIHISNHDDKPKRSARDLVTMLRDEMKAENYLSERNNYLRTASYRKNYEKYLFGTNKGKYIKLEFAYLTELSTIDMHLRFLLMRMCVDIEHALKVRILEIIAMDVNEDGYSIVDDFLKEFPYIKKNIEGKADSIFTGNLIDKYFKLCYVINKTDCINTKIVEVDCPVWVLVEIISFGDLLRFQEYYLSRKAVKNTDRNVLNSVKSLRNACAHNNCLINNICPSGTTPPSVITQFISKIPNIGKEERSNKLSCRPLFEIVCLLYVYSRSVSPDVKNARMQELKEFINGRMIRHQEYFVENQRILTAYRFIKKVVDNLN